MTTGDRIRQLRIEKGWTQEELARRCGYSGKSVISKTESAPGSVSTKKIKAIADALGVSPSSLVDWGAMASTPDDSDVSVINDFLSSADSDSIHQLRLYAEFLIKRGVIV